MLLAAINSEPEHFIGCSPGKIRVASTKWDGELSVLGQRARRAKKNGLFGTRIYVLNKGQKLRGRARPAQNGNQLLTLRSVSLLEVHGCGDAIFTPPASYSPSAEV